MDFDFVCFALLDTVTLFQNRTHPPQTWVQWHISTCFSMRELSCGDKFSHHVNQFSFGQSDQVWFDDSIWSIQGNTTLCVAVCYTDCT